MMIRLLVFLSITVIATVPAFSQTNSDVEIAATLNRISATLRLAHSESGKAGSDLELVDEQKTQLASLRAEYKELVQEFYQLESVEKNDKAAVASLVARMPVLEQKLNNEILLPHQVQILRSKVFTKFVMEQNGNMLKSLSQNYPDEFRLTESQQKKLKEIEVRVSKEIAELKKRFDQDLENIKNTARREARKALTREQIKTLKKFQDARSDR